MFKLWCEQDISDAGFHFPTGRKMTSHSEIKLVKDISLRCSFQQEVPRHLLTKPGIILKVSLDF